MIEHLKKSKAGFTLVELIVVIAILAILSGIAIPVYSGYISKANEAGDLQLLGALNTAYTAACAEMGLDPTRVVGLATLSGTKGNMTVSDVSARGTGAVALSGSSSEQFFDAFKRYYGDNIKTPFKVYESLGYDMANGVFVDGAKEVTVMYNGKPVTVTMEQLTAYNTSAFADIMSTEDMMKSVDKITILASENLATKTWSDITSILTGFEGFLTDDLKLTEEQLETLKADPKKIANAMVLFAAHGSNGLTFDQLFSIEPETGNMYISDLFDTNEVTALTVPYALAMAYANSNPTKTINIVDDPVGSIESTSLSNMGYASVEDYIMSQYGAGYTYDSYYNGNDISYGIYKIADTVNVKDYFNQQTNSLSNSTDLMTLLQSFLVDKGFQDYLKSEQATTDTNGFLAAMTMIDNNANSVDMDSLLTEGFDDPALIAMLQQILGN